MFVLRFYKFQKDNILRFYDNLFLLFLQQLILRNLFFFNNLFTQPFFIPFSLLIIFILFFKVLYSDNMSVKVGVRVRPFNQRESDLNCKLCVDMVGNMTRLFDAQDPDGGKHRDFTFDYSFWSHDEFETLENGYFVPTTDKYADQKQVFEKVGVQILNNAWEGYHCCLFAYGQTGAGKSYSMVGYGSNKGIVPISCEQIFNRIANNSNSNKEYEVQISMMEIYNQKVQDLLIPIAKRPAEGHKIRQHKTLGIYVQGMSKHFVDTYQSIEKKMEQGGRNRSVAATQMNASSSRAHTIISIEFKQTVVENNKKREKLSVIHLVDLAGSQKVGKTGATGDRLKEAAGINKSLSVLGLVISSLADKALGKVKNVVVPYRDSCLTRILQNALGGNSKTLMICAISPATDNYDETLSTLRYADQAKKIQNKAVVNQSQTDKLIRTLTQQREQLKQKIQKMQQMFKKLSMGVTPEMLQQFNEAKEQQRYVNETINDRQTSKTQKKKIEQEEQITYAVKIDTTKPHLSNLNEDPQLSRKVNYLLQQEKSKIGRRNITPPNQIEIGGMGIRELHAFIDNQNGQFYLTPIYEGSDSNCFINGDMILQKSKLYHLDRISFGTNNIFLLNLPGTQPRSQIDQKKISWDLAQNQLYLKKQIIEKQQIQQRERKMRQQAQEILRKKQQELLELQRTLKESQEMRAKALEQKQKDKIQIERKIREEQAQKLKEQIEKKKNNMRDFEFKNKENTKEKYYFERKLLKTLPKCIQLNLIAKQFKKNITLSVKMMISDGQEDDTQIDMKKRSIMIKIINKDTGYSYWWDTDTLSNRYYIIKDMAEQYFETGIVPNVEEKQDPFWDPPSPALIGRCFLTTKALTYMFDNPSTLPIIGQQEQCGQLFVNLIPTDQSGTKNLSQQIEEEQIEFEPYELLDKPFHFMLYIDEANIPHHYSKIYVQYAFKVNQFSKQIFKTKEIPQETIHPVFEYKKLHSFAIITENLLKYLQNAKLIFKVYGCQIIEKEKKKENTPKTREQQTNANKQTNPFNSNVVKQTPQILKTVKKAQIRDYNGVSIDTNKAKSQATTARKNEPNGVKKQQNSNKTGGSKVNNKINERDLKDPKNKDCEIY